jgi:hypothetical protein
MMDAVTKSSRRAAADFLPQDPFDSEVKAPVRRKRIMHHLDADVSAVVIDSNGATRGHVLETKHATRARQKVTGVVESMKAFRVEGSRGAGVRRTDHRSS